jgi:hypothetical protein
LRQLRSFSYDLWKGRVRAPSGRKGQAMTEVVLLFPIFMFFLFAFAKVFALLILMQKLEIASFYAARRWQLESHRNASYEGWDEANLRPDIQTNVLKYLGYGTPAAKFLDLIDSCRPSENCPTQPGVTVQRTQVWNVVTVTACTQGLEMPMYKTTGFVVCSTKYVPNRDRPIAFVLPGVAP